MVPALVLREVRAPINRHMKRLSFGCIAVYFGAVTLALGDPATFEFTVAAGAHERHNVPGRLEVSRYRVGAERIASVTLTGADGKSIPAQWTGPGLTSNSAGEVHFI